jgi:eukaryotic-like serine/threonine-protein kinase
LAEQSRTLADGRYALFEAIGSGGMATVYRGHDHRLGVDRAIKVLLPSFAAKPKVRARFEAEARTMAVLDHPNIVRVYDVGSSSDTAWIVMELVVGGTLLDRIGAKGISVEDCLKVTARVLEALVVAHAHGVVHRDIKPHNVLLNADDVARITDFGIARSTGLTQDELTKTGTVMGTWAFMAPEQRVNAKGVDHTADLYGMGATLFAMCTGQTPMDLFAADLDPEMLKGVPEVLVPIIRRATRYQREERYPHAMAMLEDVQATRERLGVLTEPIRTPTPVPAQVTAPALNTDPSQAANVTYVPEGLPPPPASSSMAGVAGHTPLPFRPGTPSPEFDPSEPTPPPGVAAPTIAEGTSRDRTTIALIIILLLLVGGAVRRALKPDLPPQPAIEAEAPIASPEIRQAQQTPAPVPTATPTPQNAPTDTSGQPTSKPERPKPTAAAKPIPTTKTIPEAKPEPVTPEPAKGPPGILHTPPTQARMGGFLPLQAQLSNLRPVDIQAYEITAYYRPIGTAAFQRAKLSRSRSTWTGNVRISMEMEAGLEYFLKAKTSDPSNGLKALGSGSNRSPHRVRISSP